MSQHWTIENAGEVSFTKIFFLNAVSNQHFLGSSSSRPAHSCKHIRDSGDSKGDGVYWIDPERNGNSLLVYCDMTTDGGEF